MRRIKFTDRVNACQRISLYEYGNIRNPETGKTIFCLNTQNLRYFHRETYHAKNKNKPQIISKIVTIEEVREILEKLSDGFFNFIGSTREAELERIKDGKCSCLIMSINMWDGSLL